MEMVQQSTPVLPRPVRVWVLDTVPGDTWATRQGADHPRDTIECCRTLAPPFSSRKQLVDRLTSEGFSHAGAQWMTTNLRERPSEKGGGFDWAFDLEGIAELYSSYESHSLWPLLENQPKGLHVSFVQAEHSAFVWDESVVDRLHELGAEVHVLEESSHWVHTDNPEGLLRMMAPTFQRGGRGDGEGGGSGG